MMSLSHKGWPDISKTMNKWVCPHCNTRIQTYKEEIPKLKWDDHECKFVQDSQWDHNEQVAVALIEISSNLNPSSPGSFADKLVQSSDQIGNSLNSLESRIFEGATDAYGQHQQGLVPVLQQQQTDFETRLAQLEQSIFLLRNGGESEQ